MNGIDLNKLKKRTGTAKPHQDHPQGWWLQLMQRDIVFFETFGNRQKEAFYHGMAMLLQAGMDIKAAFELLAGQQQHRKNAALLDNLKNQVVQGRTLSAAMQQHRAFSAYEFYSIQIGEETGRMAMVMEGLAAFFAKRVKQRRQLTGALTYPVIVLCTAFGAVFFMMQFMVPMFADIFSQSGNKLPAITQWIVNISGFFRAYTGWLLLVFLLAGIWLYRNRRKGWFRKYAAALWLGLPVFGPMVRQIYLARFCNSMALLTAAQVPLTKAMSLSRKMVGFYPLEQSLLQVEDDVMHGMALHTSMAAFRMYDRQLVALIKVGEEVNRLADFFAKTGEQYHAEVEHRSATLAALMEPFIIIFLGLFVGVILIAMYLPLFQMGSGLEP